MPDTPERTLPRVRVVVLNWNSWWFTRRCLRALDATEYPADRLHVVLVDNASVDGSLERLCLEFPDVAVVRNEANLGFAEGCNRAMRDLDGIEMVALVNNDAMVEPGWLGAMVSALESRPDAGAAAARLVLEPSFVRVDVEVVGGPAELVSVCVDGSDATTRTRGEGGVRSEGRTEWPMEQVHHLDGPAQMLVPTGPGAHAVQITVVGGRGLRAAIGDDRREGRPQRRAEGDPRWTVTVPVDAEAQRVELLNGLGTQRNDVAESYDRHFGARNDPSALPELAAPPRTVTGFSGGGVLLRSEMLGQVGLFDPRFFAYYEDSDLSWRAARAGWATITAPGAIIRHAFGGSGGSRAPGFFFLNYRNWLVTVLRNAEGAERRRALASARERVGRAVRGNVASPLRHGRAPSWLLVRAWARTVCGVAAVRWSERREVTSHPVGARRTDRVRCAFQPSFEPRAPAPRPGGPRLAYLDLSAEVDGSPGAGTSLLIAASGVGTDLDLVPVVRSAGGGWRRVSPAEMGPLLGVPGPHHHASVGDLELPAPPAGSVVLRAGPRNGLLEMSTVGGRPSTSPLPPELAVVVAAIAALGDRGSDDEPDGDHGE